MWCLWRKLSVVQKHAIVLFQMERKQESLTTPAELLSLITIILISMNEKYLQIHNEYRIHGREYKNLQVRGQRVAIVDRGQWTRDADES